MQHLPADALVLIVGRVSKSKAANLAITCKALNCKLPERLRREAHGTQILLKQSKRFLRCIPAIQALRSFLQQKNQIFSFYPPQQELLQLAFAPAAYRQTNFTDILNQDLLGIEFALVGMLTYWAEVYLPCCTCCPGQPKTVAKVTVPSIYAGMHLPYCHTAKRMLPAGIAISSRH